MKIIKENNIPEYVGFNKYNKDSGVSNELNSSLIESESKLNKLKRDRRGI